MRDDVREEGCADQHARDAEAGESPRSDGLCPLEGPDGPGLLEGAVGGGDIEQMNARAQDNPALEAPARSEVTVRNHIQADDEGHGEKEESAEHSGVERPTLAEFAPLGLVGRRGEG